MNIASICKRRIVTIDSAGTLEQAAGLMREHHVGALVVTGQTDEGLRVDGVVTDRDLVVDVLARSQPALDAFVAEHPGSQAMTLDVGDRAAMARTLQGVHALHGRLDLAMYCAGHYQSMRASEFDLGQMLRHLQVNYVGALYMLEVVLPTLIKQRSGHISLVASVAGYR